MLATTSQQDTVGCLPMALIRQHDRPPPFEGVLPVDALRCDVAVHAPRTRRATVIARELGEAAGLARGDPGADFARRTLCGVG